jgi:muconolactone delta-isomerase
MKLTKLQRDAFISAVMNDVPMIDYRERARVALQKKAIDLLPAKLKALHKDFGHWFKTDIIWKMPGRLRNVSVVSHNDNETMKQMQADGDFWASIEEMARLDTEQDDARTALHSKLHAVIYSCTTVKQAHEQLPEFAKYLPDPDAPTDRSVPVVANLVADLTAAGWPKDKKPAARSRK